MRYLYYTLYRILLKVKTNDTPDWNAMFLISVFEGLNIQTIMFFMPQTLEKRFNINNQLWLFAILPCLILFGINYFVFVKNTTKLRTKYEGESERSKTVGVMLLLTYVVITFAFLFISANNPR